MAAGNTNFDAILTTTLNKHSRTIEDNIFKNNALLWYLTQADHIDTVDGGAKIVEPLVYAMNTTAGSYSGYDNISTVPQEGLSAAEYDWKQMAVSVAISGLDKIKNNGDPAIISLMEAKIQQARLSLEDSFEQKLFGDGTGNSSKDFNGLLYFCPDTVTTGTVGGIDRSDSLNTFWRPTATSVSGVLTITGSTGVSRLYNTVSRGKDHPDFALTNVAQWEAYEALLQPQQRFSNPDTGSAGFENLMYKQSAVMYADYCPSDEWYFLNSKYLRLKRHSQVWFENTPFERPVGQHAWYSLILLAGNLTMSNCLRGIGKLHALT